MQQPLRLERLRHANQRNLASADYVQTYEGLMPLINGRFYINPAIGRAIEGTRENDASEDTNSSGDDGDSHWVTIDHRHVLIDANQSAKRHHRRSKGQTLTPREKQFLDKYYDAVTSKAKPFNVDPVFVLGVAAESGFATTGTYLRTGDAFGMTGGSTMHMTSASSPEDNVRQFFENYGEQIRGARNAGAFLDALQGLNASGQRVKGWKVYNTVKAPAWYTLVRGGITEMERAVPLYQEEKSRKDKP